MDFKHIIAYIFSTVAASIVAYSTFSKKKDKMLYLQCVDTLFHAVSNLFIGSLSAVTTNLISTVRNFLNAKGMNNKYLNAIILLFIIGMGLLVNKSGLIGIIPIIASAEYTIGTYYSKNAQQTRYLLVVNLLLWGIYDIFVKMWPSAIMDIIIIAFTSYNIVKNILENKRKEKELNDSDDLIFIVDNDFPPFMFILFPLLLLTSMIVTFIVVMF